MNDQERNYLILQKAANYLITPNPNQTGTLLGLSLLKCSLDKIGGVYLSDDPDSMVADAKAVYLSNWKALMLYDEEYVDIEDGWSEFVIGQVKKAFVTVLNCKWVQLWYRADSDSFITNQNPYIEEPLIYEKMRFSSPPEVEIAKALDRLGVMYIPNCVIRVGSHEKRQRYIPDFLICHKGKWGILEVDGKTFHTPLSATQDHERSQAIQMNAKVYFTRFAAKRCMDNPDEVVKTFLSLLENQ